MRWHDYLSELNKLQCPAVVEDNIKGTAKYRTIHAKPETFCLFSASLLKHFIGHSHDHEPQ